MKGILLAVGFLLGVVFTSLSQNILFPPKAPRETVDPVVAPDAPHIEIVPAKATPVPENTPKPKPVAEGGTGFDDRREVLEYQLQSARKGNAQAKYAMALRYLHGIDVPKNETLAMEYLHDARNAGEVRARDKITELEREKRKAAAKLRDVKETAFLAELEKYHEK
jgi:hypothetical protein